VREKKKKGTGKSPVKEGLYHAGGVNESRKLSDTEKGGWVRNNPGKRRGPESPGRLASF